MDAPESGSGCIPNVNSQADISSVFSCGRPIKNGPDIRTFDYDHWKETEFSWGTDMKLQENKPPGKKTLPMTEAYFKQLIRGFDRIIETLGWKLNPLTDPFLTLEAVEYKADLKFGYPS